MRMAIRRSLRGLLSGAFLAGVIVACSVAGRAEEPMSTEEVVTELVEITTQVTPFTVAYDKEAKTLTFRERVENSNSAIPTRIGELRARLDRMDQGRMNYIPLAESPFRIVIGGKKIAGRINFYCSTGEKCIARDLHDVGVAPTFTDGDEETFGLDVFEGAELGRLQRMANLISHLMIVSKPK
jgi:hypothetical protein